jgi:nickel-dependent lactate racemase
MPTLHYGTGSTIHFDLGDHTEPVECGRPRGEPIDDLASAVSAAMAEPLDYPPLPQTVTPGDRIVLPLAEGTPQAAEITAAVVRALISAGVSPDGISILRTEGDVQAGGDDPCSQIEEVALGKIRLVTHDSANRRAMAYLATTEGGEPILLDRLLTDADLVLPIGCLQAEKTVGYFGIHSPIFPALSDERTHARFRRVGELRGAGPDHRTLKHEVEEVAWLLGVNLTVQVIPAASQGVLHVVAGQSDAVRRRCRELYRAAWGESVAGRANLVIAAIEGPREQQTWANLGRAIHRAGQLVEDGGAIAVCCDLAGEPGPGVQQLIGASSLESALRRLRRDCPVDALPAVQLTQAVRRGRVYLLSRLDPAMVESLEMTPVEDSQDLVRLARRSGTCILLSNAAHAMVSVENE